MDAHNVSLAQKGAVEGGRRFTSLLISCRILMRIRIKREKVDPNLDGSATLEIGIQPHLAVRGKSLYNNSV